MKSSVSILLALVTLSAGCGEDEPSSGLATIMVKPGGEPAEGVTVAFQDADGEVVAEQVTGGDGSAMQEVGRDGMVTFALGQDLYTVTDVQPLDVIELLSDPYRFESDVVGQVNVTGEPVDGATEYWIAVGCELLRGRDSISPAELLTVREDCLSDDGTFDILVEAVDAENDKLAFAYRTDVTPDASGTTEVAIEWEPEPPTVDFAYEGEQPGVRQFFAEIDEQRKGLSFAGDDETSDGAPVFVHHLAGFSDSVRVRVAVSWEDTYSDWVASIETPIADSFALTDDDLAPILSAGAVDLSTPKRPIASWSGDSDPADGLHIQLALNDESTGDARIWFAVVPPGSKEFRFPALPESLSALGPGPGMTVSESGAWVAEMEADFTDGFGEFRERCLLGYWDSYHPYGEPTYSARHTLAGLHESAALQER